ncbi:Hypothetical predicted protein [Podarcis lilfordi]|uniref:Uncharacterized protein n=1 Tax=Podarcis lilfordi TaxID=74358 RepID=A0AA35JQX7_9SAUR|nr:Hypothetical predicted protein [Podarcis lilfordi]
MEAPLQVWAGLPAPCEEEEEEEENDDDDGDCEEFPLVALALRGRALSGPPPPGLAFRRPGAKKLLSSSARSLSLGT